MRFPTLLGIALLSAFLATGCHSPKKPDDADASQTSASKSAAADLPPAVRDAFARNYPDSKITSVQKREPSSGAPYYQINFIQNGLAGSVSFFATGQARPSF